MESKWKEEESMLRSLKMTEVAEAALEETTTAEVTDLAVAVDSEATEIQLQEEKVDSEVIEVEATEAVHQTDHVEEKVFLQIVQTVLIVQEEKADFLSALQDVLKTDRNFRNQEELEETKSFS